MYQFYVDPHVPSIWPTTGPAWGSTVVTLNGTQFINTQHLVCLFGTHPRVVAKWHSSTTIECLSPVEVGATTMAIEISNNNQDFTQDGVVFGYEGSCLSLCFLAY